MFDVVFYIEIFCDILNKLITMGYYENAKHGVLHKETRKLERKEKANKSRDNRKIFFPGRIPGTSGYESTTLSVLLLHYCLQIKKRVISLEYICRRLKH